MKQQELNNLYRNNVLIKYTWLADVLKDSNIREHGRIIAHTLVRYCGTNGRIFPSYKQLARDIGASEMTARRGAQELILNGYLIVKRQRTNNQYHFKSVQIESKSVQIENESVQIEHPNNIKHNYKDNYKNIKDPKGLNNDDIEVKPIDTGSSDKTYGAEEFE